MSEEGSLHKVPLTKIKEIFPHTNATSLEFARVFDFNVIVRKNEYIVGQEVIYIPIDSVLPKNIEDKLFPPDSKIKLHNGRVKQIKIRNQYSQGMIITVEDVAEFLGMDRVRRLGTYEENEDLSADLGITKYQPPEAAYQGSNTSQRRDKPKENPLFHQYNGVENVKWYPDLFKEDEEVVIQEKLHGSLCRAAILPFKANTLWKRLLKLLNLSPKYEHCYGSNNVQIQERKGYKGWYGENVYGKVLEKVKAFEKIQPGETIYGELIGEGIQKNYTYGHKEHHFVLFDVKVLKEDGTQTWLSPEQVQEYAIRRGFDFVPVLYQGLFNKELAYEMTKGNSIYNSSQKIREGIVIKSRHNYNDDYMPSKKKCVKWLSEKYLEGDQSDFR